MKRLPVFATLVVLLAVATMIGLGVWQLSRAREKEALLAQYRAAGGAPPVTYLSVSLGMNPLYRRTSATCERPDNEVSRVIAGRNTRGQSGYVHLIDCPDLRVELGWSNRPKSVRWEGGMVSGMIAPDNERGDRVVSAVGLAGLEASAAPDIANIPNNHRSYAFQWFAFAASALVIYALALRRRRA